MTQYRIITLTDRIKKEYNLNIYRPQYKTIATDFWQDFVGYEKSSWDHNIVIEFYSKEEAIDFIAKIKNDIISSSWLVV